MGNSLLDDLKEADQENAAKVKGEKSAKAGGDTQGGRKVKGAASVGGEPQKSDSGSDSSPVANAAARLMTRKAPKKIQVPSYMDETTIQDLDKWCLNMTIENRKLEPTSKPISRAGAIEAIVQEFLERNKVV